MPLRDHVVFNIVECILRVALQIQTNFQKIKTARQHLGKIHPVVKKKYYLNLFLRWREEMEDAHTTLLSLGPEHPDCAFYGVYDGHCGHSIARYCGENLHKRVVASPHFAAGDYGAAFQEVYVQFHTTRLLHLIIHSVPPTSL